MSEGAKPGPWRCARFLRAFPGGRRMGLVPKGDSRQRRFCRNWRRSIPADSAAGGEGALSPGTWSPHSCSPEVQLAPHVFEVEKPRLADQPLGGAHRAFGESATRFGVVTDVNGVVWRIEDHLVHSDHLAFAEGGDFEFVAGGIFDDAPEYNSGPRGRIHLVDVMALKNLTGIAMLQRGCRRTGDLVKQVH